MFEWLKDKLKKQEDKKENAENDNLEENVEESIEKIKIDDPLEGNGENSELEDKDELKKENDENFKTSESNEKDLITDEIEKDEEQVVNEENSTKEDNIKEELENIEIQEEEIDEINISNDVENLKEPSLIETDAISNIKEEKETQEENLENKDEAIEDKNLEDKDTTSDEENLDKKTDFIKEDNSEEIKEKEEPKKTSLFQRLKEGLDKTRKEVGIKINTVIGSYVKIDDEMLEDLEDILISADVGMETTMKLIDNLRETIIREKINDPEEVKPLLMQEAKKLMNPELNTPINTDPPVIILVVGVNGVGKTTTIGKLSARFKSENKSVLVCAADTFRAAAIDQLREWGNRANVDVISHDEGSDPASVVFDAIEAAKARSTDVLIVDTAGRLHNKSNLMKELEKINRIISNKFPEANRENLLVLDSTTGQNAINQAKTFKEVTDITGIALTKLDGTAKGGVVIALQSELNIPIKLIGVGEGIDDLQDFDIDNFLETIFS